MAIDFVISWADTTDPEWLARRSRFVAPVERDEHGDFAAKNQPWDTLRYLFRGIDRHCPWVGRVHLVVPPGQRPDWLNTLHPKLRVVDQDTLLAAEHVPTFNSNAIEMNLHRIPDLADDFVYFNDDMLVLAPIEAEHFFPGGAPADFAIMNALSGGDALSHYLLNSIGVINRNFDKRQVLRAGLGRWFNPKYGAGLLRNLLLLPWPGFTGFFEPHLPIALRKRTIEALWEREPAIMQATSASRVRELSNLSPFVFRYWQICSGDFEPVCPKSYGIFYELGRDDIGSITASIRSGKQPLVCVNDGAAQDFDAQRLILLGALEHALPGPSSFELRASNEKVTV